MRRNTWWILFGVMALLVALSGLIACGDDDDDDDDSSATYADQCEEYVDAFMNGGGLFGDCFDDQTYEDSLMEECPKFDEGDVEESQPALDCMEALNCDDYDDALGLYQAILDCMGPAIQ